MSCVRSKLAATWVQDVYSFDTSTRIFQSMYVGYYCGTTNSIY